VPLAADRRDAAKPIAARQIVAAPTDSQLVVPAELTWLISARTSDSEALLAGRRDDACRPEVGAKKEI